MDLEAVRGDRGSTNVILYERILSEEVYMVLTENQQFVVKELMRSNFEFRKLYKEHETMEEKLRTFDNKKHLSSEEEAERKHIQKMKLSGKDRMYELIRATQESKFSA